MSERATYVFDAAAWQTRNDALDELLSTLPVPAHTGRNLDALADALWEVPACELVITHAARLNGSAPLGRWGKALLRVLLDAANHRRDLHVRLVPLGHRLSA